MTETPKRFTSYAELRGRPAFDPDYVITSKNFRSLIGPYTLPKIEWVFCHFVLKTGRCGKKHGEGFLGVSDSGIEGLIGGHCATKHLNADERFLAERARLRRELATIDLISQIETARKTPDFVDRVQDAKKRFTQHRSRMLALSARIPVSARRVLEAMARTSNCWVPIQVAHLEDEDEEGNKTYRWEKESLGDVKGVSIWGIALDLVWRDLTDVTRALEVSALTNSQSTPKLRKLVAALETLPRSISALERAEADEKLFNDPANFQLLCYLVPNDDDRRSLAKLSINRTSQDRTDAARELIRQLDTELIRSNNGRQIRIP